MPAQPPPKDNPFWLGGWPMTLGRIRNFVTAWKGQPASRVPFGCHAIKYLLACLDGEITPQETDPDDAPWVLHPRKPGNRIDYNLVQHTKVEPAVAATEADPMMETVWENTDQIDRHNDDGGWLEQVAEPFDRAAAIAQAVKDAQDEGKASAVITMEPDRSISVNESPLLDPLGETPAPPEEAPEEEGLW